MDPEDPTCPNCSRQNPHHQTANRVGFRASIRYATKMIQTKPILLLPSFIYTLIEFYFGVSLLSAISDKGLLDLLPQYSDGPISVSYSPNALPISQEVYTMILVAFAYLLLIVFASGIFDFMTVIQTWGYMQKDDYTLNEGISNLVKKLGTIVLSIIVQSIMMLTIILIPAALYLYAVMVVDDTGIREAVSRSFSLSIRNLKSSIAFLVFYMFSVYLLSLVPHIGTLLEALPRALTMIAIVKFYASSSVHLEATEDVVLKETVVVKEDPYSATKNLIIAILLLIVIVGGLYATTNTDLEPPDYNGPPESGGSNEPPPSEEHGQLPSSGKDGFSSFTELDLLDRLSHTNTRSTFTDMEPTDSNVYLYKDYGEGYFDNFTLNFDFKVTKIDCDTDVSNKLCLILLSNKLGSARQLVETGRSIIKIILRCDESGYVLRLGESYNRENTLLDTAELQTNILYHATLIKQENTLALIIYDDPQRTNQLTGKSINLRGDWAFRYLEAPASMGYNDGNDLKTDGYIENLNIEK